MRVACERQSTSIKVFSDIRFLKLLSCLLVLFTSPLLLAQEQPELTAQLQTNEQPNSEPLEVQTQVNQTQENLEQAPQSSSSDTNPKAILRLEDTIRGNKEQPQVLTIVPWQLPVHQRINENTQWQLQVNQLTSIERNAFLRQLAVVKELKSAQAKPLSTNAAALDPKQ